MLPVQYISHKKRQLSLGSAVFWYCLLIAGRLSWKTFCFQLFSRRYQTTHSRAPSANVCWYILQITSNLKITWWVPWYVRAAASFPSLTNKCDFFFFFTIYCPFRFCLCDRKPRTAGNENNESLRPKKLTLKCEHELSVKFFLLNGGLV